jgi:hypothetical protein
MKKIFTILLTAALALSAHAGLIISVNGHGEISGDSLAIELNEATYNPLTEEMQMNVEGNILVSDAVNNALAVSIFRSEEGIVDEFCCGTDCRAGNGQTAQRGSYDVSQWAGPQTWFIHFSPAAGRATDVTTKYIFSDGVNQKTLIVHFVYEGTSLEEITADNDAKQGVFTVFGQQLRSDNNTDNLPAGLYIVGGKKMIIH